MNCCRFLGALTVPILAAAYAIYSYREQTGGYYREDTVLYMMVLIMPTLLLAGYIGLKSLYQGWRINDEGNSAEPDKSDISDVRNNLSAILLISATISFVLVVHWLGYLITLSAFTMITLVAMGVRSVFPIVLTTVAAVSFVQVVFIEILGQQLPRGILSTLSLWP